MLLPQSQTAAPAFRGSPAPCNGLLRATSPSTNLRHLLSQASSTKCQALPATGPDASSARATQPSSSRCTWCPQSHEQNAEPRRATQSHMQHGGTGGQTQHRRRAMTTCRSSCRGACLEPREPPMCRTLAICSKLSAQYVAHCPPGPNKGASLMVQPSHKLSPQPLPQPSPQLSHLDDVDAEPGEQAWAKAAAARQAGVYSREIGSQDRATAALVTEQ